MAETLKGYIFDTGTVKVPYVDRGDGVFVPQPNLTDISGFPVKTPTSVLKDLEIEASQGVKESTEGSTCISVSVPVRTK